MTYNLKLAAKRDLRDRILERIEVTYPGTLVAENMWFNGTIGGKQIIGLGFQREEDRVMFMLEFKEHNDRLHLEPTDKDLKWGYDFNDIDF